MINYTIVGKTETEVTIQIEDSTQWSFKGEKDIKVKKMKIAEATAFFTKLKQQRLDQQQFLNEKIDAEVLSIESIISQI
jgi:hypothetical protein